MLGKRSGSQLKLAEFMLDTTQMDTGPSDNEVQGYFEIPARVLDDGSPELASRAASFRALLAQKPSRLASGPGR